MLTNEKGQGSALLLMSGVIIIWVVLLFTLIHLDSKDFNERLESDGTEAVTSFYDGKTVTDVKVRDSDEFGWNRKVTFLDGETTFVKVECEKEYVSSFERLLTDEGMEKHKKKAECEVVEVDKISD